MTPEQALAHAWLNRPAEAVVPNDDYAMDMGSMVPDFASAGMSSVGSQSSATLAGGAVAAALAATMDTGASPAIPPADLMAQPGSLPPAAALPSPQPPVSSALPPVSPDPAGIAIPARGQGQLSPNLAMYQQLGVSAPPDVIYAAMNSMASKPSGVAMSVSSYGDAGAGAESLPNAGMLSRSVAMYGSSLQQKPNLINHVRYNFNARRTFRRAVDKIKAVNRLTGLGREASSRSNLSASNSQSDLAAHLSRDNSDDSANTAIRPPSPHMGVLPKPMETESNSPGSEGTARDDSADLLKARSDGTLADEVEAMEIDAV